ncbi:MAG: transporter substrate-binding domain-containing protein [Hyphomicrobium sp.]
MRIGINKKDEIAPILRTSFITFISSFFFVANYIPLFAQEPRLPDQPRRVVIRFMTDGDYPPFNYIDNEGKLTGFNVDLAGAICAEANAACDIKVRPWEELFDALKKGEADAVIAGHAVTAKSLREVDFTDRYFYTPGRFAAKTSAEKKEVNPESFDGRSIAVAKDSPHEAYLKAFFKNSTIQTFESNEQARDALMQGKTEYLFEDGISLAFWINGTLSRRCCELRGGAYLEPKFFGDGIAIAIPYNDPQIKVLLNNALQNLRRNGKYEELIARYFPFKIF